MNPGRPHQLRPMMRFAATGTKVYFDECPDVWLPPPVIRRFAGIPRGSPATFLVVLAKPEPALRIVAIRSNVSVDKAISEPRDLRTNQLRLPASAASPNAAAPRRIVLLRRRQEILPLLWQ